MNATKQLGNSNLWTIVLAAGEGSRLRSLTGALHGEPLPKQFAVLQGRQSLLQATLQRTSRLTPSHRTVVVVAGERERLAKEQLRRFDGVDIVAQPRNIGTGPGLLLPLSHVMAADPDAVVVVVPADHFVRDEATFIESVREAEAIARREDSVVLLAAVPEGPETQYGWIETAETGDRRVVSSFVEKPSEAVAEKLFRAGALWNTFVMVGPARRFWELGNEHLAEQSALFDLYRNTVGSTYERRALARLYDRMLPADFSRDVIEKTRSLCVTPLADCGWSDWGTPERVFKSLQGTHDYEVLMNRLNRTVAPADRRPVAVEPQGHSLGV